MQRIVADRHRRESTIGDMRLRVKVHLRTIVDPVFSSVDFTENFAEAKEVWANIRTVSGQVFFTGINADVAITHEIIIRSDPVITDEAWIEFESEYLRIVDIEDYDERHEFMRLRCTNRGDKTLGASKA